MALAKLHIKPRPPSGLAQQFGPNGIEVMFNPNAYSVTKSVTWSPPQQESGKKTGSDRKVNAPTLTFGGGGSRQLTLELFFDVTENISIKDVRQETNKLVTLTRIERDLGQPPVCEVSWGDAPASSDFPFIGVVTNLSQRFTLFTSEGTPVRANLSVTFLEFVDPEADQRETDPELTTHVIRRGDTLSSIAAMTYRDPSLWRVIARANRMDDPRQLTPGRRLTIPKLN